MTKKFVDQEEVNFWRSPNKAKIDFLRKIKPLDLDG